VSVPLLRTLEAGGFEHLRRLPQVPALVRDHHRERRAISISISTVGVCAHATPLTSSTATTPTTDLRTGDHEPETKKLALEARMHLEAPEPLLLFDVPVPTALYYFEGPIIHRESARLSPNDWTLGGALAANRDMLAIVPDLETANRLQAFPEIEVHDMASEGGLLLLELALPER
jgi:hypothetical protein